MYDLLLALALLAPSGPVQDTILAVRPGDRLVLRDFAGSVAAEGWEGTELWVEAEEDESLGFRFTRTGNQLELKVLDEKRRNRSEELRIRLPRWMALEIVGRRLEAEVEGMEGEVLIRTLEGDLTLKDLSGDVLVSTVEGTVEGRGLHGSHRIRTGEDDITVEDCTGELEVQSVSGDIELSRCDATRLDAQTTDGDVDFSGRLLPGGTYAFRSHGGELTLTLQEPVDADFTVLVYEGELESDFPMRTESFRSGRDLRFSVGNGGARVVLEAFDGEVVLRRGDPGDFRR